jgi:putative flippase GtrA
VKRLIRWGKFNLVGAMGMAVQLGVLALLNRWSAGHYLYASAAAVELAILHNFAWHIRYTWRDRNDNSDRLSQLIRFHLSNGLVSMLGNLALMRILVDEMRLPVLAANSVAVLCCSLVNFGLGDAWVFAAGGKPVREQAAIRPL